MQTHQLRRVAARRPAVKQTGAAADPALTSALRAAGRCALALLLLPGVAAAQSGPATELVSRDLALATFDSAWTRIAANYYDTLMNGLDWNSVRTELRPRAEKVRTTAELRVVLNDMLRRLGESHFTLIPREASSAFVGDTSASGTSMPGEVGIELRLVDGQVLVARVDSGGTAYRAGVRAGWRVYSVDTLRADSAMAQVADSAGIYGSRRSYLRVVMRMQTLLRGESGSMASLVAAAPDGEPSTLLLEREPANGQVVKYGNLPAVVARVDYASLPAGSSCVGSVRFNTWMPPMAVRIDAAVDALRQCEGIVIDLRGNTGGVAAMVMGVAGHFLERRDTLGVLRMRTDVRSLIANPRLSNARGERVAPFGGKLAILVDNLTASTSELFASALQALGRARIFGDTTAGQALPATLSQLPNRDVLMIVVGDLRGPRGDRIEGHGVVPDELYPWKREDLLSSRDSAMEAALRWLRGVGNPQ